MSDTKRNWVERVMGTYESALIRYARSYCGNLETARDAVQDTFIKLCELSPEQFPAGEKAWLYKVCRNRCLELLRKEGRVMTMNELTLEQVPGREANPAGSVESADQWQLACEMMTRLNDKQQELIRLKYQQHLSYREISEITGLTVSNVGVTLHQAMRQLRSFMIQVEEVTR